MFVCGYKADVIRAAYPDLTYVENRDWERNNILLSLLHAREHLANGFVSTYADIVYRPAAVADLVRSPHDITVVSDTDWRRRYVGRSQHPETDAEKMQAPTATEIGSGSRARSPPTTATGEFIGVMRSPRAARGASSPASTPRRRRSRRPVFREGRTFEKAYLIDLLAAHDRVRRADHCELDTTAATWRSIPSKTRRSPSVVARRLTITRLLVLEILDDPRGSARCPSKTARTSITPVPILVYETVAAKEHLPNVITADLGNDAPSAGRPRCLPRTLTQSFHPAARRRGVVTCDEAADLEKVL